MRRTVEDKAAEDGAQRIPATSMSERLVAFGPYIRARREALQQRGEAMSLRKFATELGIEPAYLSKIERSIFAPPSEDLIVRMAARLGENPDYLLALGGKVATDLKEMILRRPELMGELLRKLDRQSDLRITKVLRNVRDGEW